jgi:hypothetical protein
VSIFVFNSCLFLYFALLRLDALSQPISENNDWVEDASEQQGDCPAFMTARVEATVRHPVYARIDKPITDWVGEQGDRLLHPFPIVHKS